MSLALHISQGFSLLLEGWALVLALFNLLCMLALAVTAMKAMLKPAAMLGLILFGSAAVLIPNALLAKDETWKVMYAAYVSAPPTRSPTMARDISRIWSSTARSVLVRDWYFTARRWGICHELWSETGCTPAPVKREAIGIARDALGEVAGTRREGQPGVLWISPRA